MLRACFKSPGLILRSPRSGRLEGCAALRAPQGEDVGFMSVFETGSYTSNFPFLGR